MLLVNCIIEIDGTEPSDIAEVIIPFSQDYEGIGGWMSLDENGDRQPQLYNIVGFYKDPDSGEYLSGHFGLFDGHLGEVQWEDDALEDLAGIKRAGEVLVIDYFSVDGFTLSWSVSDATHVSINQGIGVVESTGSIAVSPTETTMYTLTATKGDRSTDETVQVVVEEIDVPVFDDFSANPSILTLTCYPLSDTTTPTHYTLGILTDVLTASVPIDYVKVIFPEDINGESELQLSLGDPINDLVTYVDWFDMPSPVTGEFIFEFGASGETHQETVQVYPDSYSQYTMDVSSPQEGQHFTSSDDLVFNWTTDQTNHDGYQVCLYQGTDEILVYENDTLEILPLNYDGPKLDPDYYNLYLYTFNMIHGHIVVYGRIFIDN